jgi:hypothetical protein
LFARFLLTPRLGRGGRDAPRGTRTPNLLIRSQMLYPIELWAQGGGKATRKLVEQHRVDKPPI